MRLQLLENALDSLKFGLKFYQEFLNFENLYDDEISGYLKMAVICIHNSVELLSKNMLSNIDELLIYKDISNNDLLIRLGQNRDNEFRVPLHYSLIMGDVNVQTIDYSECIRRIMYVFDIRKSQYQDLIELSEARNKLIHFGIDRTIDFHEILGVVNRTLDFIIEFFYSYFNNGKESNPMESLYDPILDIIEEGEVAEANVWHGFNSQQFSLLKKLLLQVCANSELNGYLLSKGFKMSLDTDEYDDSNYFVITLSSNLFEDKFEQYILRTSNIPRLNCTVFTRDYDESIFAVIDYLEDNKPLYIYHEPYQLERYYESVIKFWKNSKRCYKTELCVEQLIVLIKRLCAAERQITNVPET